MSKEDYDVSLNIFAQRLLCNEDRAYQLRNKTSEANTNKTKKKNEESCFTVFKNTK